MRDFMPSSANFRDHDPPGMSVSDNKIALHRNMAQSDFP